MADPRPPITPADLSAAVAAGLVSEAQAAALTAFTAARAGRRLALAPGEEPFELYRGFNDVFVTVGLVLLLIGIGFAVPGGALTLVFGATDDLIHLADLALIAGIVNLGLSWGLAEYLTRRRRMVLPSVVLSAHFAASALAAAGGVLTGWREGPGGADGLSLLVALLATAAASGAFFLRFRLPFGILPAGAATLAAALVATGMIDPGAADLLIAEGPAALIDLRRGGSFALVTLGFGVAALALALRLDMADPYRVGRASATAFWLHLMAAPAIVNTAAFTLWRMGTEAGSAALIVFLALMAAVALAIDRRSFLVAGLGYVAALVGSGVEGAVEGALAMATIGAAVVAIGAGWTGLRRRLLALLPEFPGKSRLPPAAPPPTAPRLAPEAP